MHRITYVILALLLPFMSIAQSWKTFSDTSILFTAKYPSNWVNKIKEDKRVFFTSPSAGTNDIFLENVNVSVIQGDDFGTTKKIKDVIPSIITSLKEVFTSFKMEQEKYFKWNTADACEIVYTGYNANSPDTKVRMIQWFCFYRSRLYTATFSSIVSTSIHTATARKILNSIVFSKQ